MKDLSFDPQQAWDGKSPILVTGETPPSYKYFALSKIRRADKKTGFTITIEITPIFDNVRALLSAIVGGNFKPEIEYDEIPAIVGMSCLFEYEWILALNEEQLKVMNPLILVNQQNQPIRMQDGRYYIRAECIYEFFTTIVPAHISIPSAIHRMAEEQVDSAFTFDQVFVIQVPEPGANEIYSILRGG